ncbi:MAG TPA: metallophosphoesterase [Candidatus Tumulicola sp.]|jgi:predicted phosphodiesterase
MARILSAFLLALVLLGAAPRDQLWIVASDIHLNPFDRSTLPSPSRRDGNAALLNSLVRAMRAAAPNPSLVVLPGDFLAHHFDLRSHEHRTPGDLAGLHAMAAIASSLGTAFPKSRFAVALGNNDAPCGDYRTDFETPYARAMSQIWGPLIARGADAASTALLARDGYYALRPFDGVRVAVLDTVVFSQMQQGACRGSLAALPQRQIDWLDATLPATPAGVRNVLLMHVPPGYDAFSTQIARGFLAWPFLRAPWNAQLAQTIANPRNRVAFAVAGHTHRFDLRLAGDVPVAVFGAVSPIYENNPLFYVVHVGPNATLHDVDFYAFDERTQSWIGPRRFDSMWNVDGIDATTVRALHERLGRDEAMRTSWGLASSGWPDQGSAMTGMWRARWRIAWCAQVELGPRFERCAGIGSRVALTRIGVVAGALAAIAALGLLIAVMIRTAAKRR